METVKNHITDYREILRTEFLKRREKEAFYSLRSFAKDLGFSVQHLSLVFKGKRGISKDKVGRICNRLKFKPFESHYFAFLVRSQSARALHIRNAAKQGLRRPHFKATALELHRRAQNQLSPLPPIIKKMGLRKR